MKVIKIQFHIIDNEFDDEYDFDGYFDDHEEAMRFIAENEEVGNIITVMHVELVTIQAKPNC